MTNRSSCLKLVVAAAALLAACGGGSDSPVVVPAPNPSITVTPATISVNAVQGGNATLAVTVVRNDGYAGAVDLTVEGAPTGVTSTFTPPTLANGSTSSSLVLAVAGTVAASSYPLIVRGHGQGVADQTVGLTLVVAQRSGTNVSLKYCGAIPIWVAAQSDGGAWVPLAPTAPNTYSFSVSTRGGLATVYSTGGGFETSVTYASASELADVGAASIAACATPELGTRSLHGTVANLGAATAHVALGAALADVSGGSNSFTLDGAPDQASDLLLGRDTDATGFAPNTDRMIIRRGLNLPSGATIPVLDLSSSEAFPTATAKATIAGLGADAAVVISDFITATRTSGRLSVNPQGTALSAFTVVPPSQLAAGDIHQLIVAGESLDGNAVREAAAWFHTPSDRTVTLGPALATPTITTVFAGAPQRLRVQLPSQSDYSASVFVEFDQDDGLFLHQDVMLSVAASYAGGTPSTWDLAIPDLSAAGYNAAWGLRSGLAADWFVGASSRTVLDEGLPRDGATESLAARFGSATGLAAARTRRGGLVRGLRVVR